MPCWAHSKKSTCDIFVSAFLFDTNKLQTKTLVFGCFEKEGPISLELPAVLVYLNILALLLLVLSFYNAVEKALAKHDIGQFQYIYWRVLELKCFIIRYSINFPPYLYVSNLFGTEDSLP